MHWIGSIVNKGRGIVVESTVLFVVQPDMNRATQFWKIAVKISKKEFDVPAEDLIVDPCEVPLGVVRLQMFGAEHPDRPLKLETGQGKVEGDHQQKSGLP